ncbi:MAG: protein translocase subunit SecDF [Bacteroidetes bacterium]|nr:protein translocase subunit SecDF [Bacteroidota bacterium]
MQGKGLVSTVFALLILACIYQLSFTFASKRVESKARAHSEQAIAGLSADTPIEEKERLRLKAEQEYLDQKADEKVLLWYTYQDCKERELNLGLDLQGGMSVVMEVSNYDLVRKLAGRNSNDPVLVKALEAARGQEGQGQGEFINLFVKAYQDQNPGGQLVTLFSSIDNEDELDRSANNNQVAEFLTKKSEEGYQATLTKLRERIDRFGVAQASITPVEGQGRIVVELPGVDNPKQVKRLLQATANLEFWQSQSLTQEFADRLDRADKKSASLLELGLIGATASPVERVSSNAEALLTAPEQALDTLTESAENLLEGTTTADNGTSISTDSGAALEEAPVVESAPTAQDSLPAGPLFSRIQFAQGPGYLGLVNQQDTGMVMDILRTPEVARDFPLHRFAWSALPTKEDKAMYELYALMLTPDGSNTALLEGDLIKLARADFDPMNGQPIVTMVMNARGAKDWARVTTDHVGDNIAVVLDNRVYSAPVIQEPITNGSSRISGNFDPEDVTTLASILETGKLPVKSSIVQEDTVGPTLGAEQIRRGIIALVLGLVVVLIFMVVYYSTGGIVADLVLLANIFFVFGILSAWGATLTLPGLAGIVLTVGMAVDANVIIFERIREELAKGKSMLKAITDGYSNSYSAIIDANITTLIVAFILNTFGLGPVRGFAVVLIIGIFSSLFTAIFLTRLIFDRWNHQNRPIKFHSSFSDKALKNINFDFVGKRKQFYALSGVIILAGVLSLAIGGLNLGVDFKGGRSYTVAFDQSINAETVRGALEKDFDPNVVVKSFSSANRLKITTAKDITVTTAAQDSLTTANLYASLLPFYADPNLSFDGWDQTYKEQQQKVQASIAQDIQRSSYIAGLLAIAGIFLYILFRFRRWQFGFGAIAALLHDVLIVLGIFSIFRNIMPFSMEIGETFIAAILTVIGYSVNDTVVVFDRIREYMRESKAGTRTEIINSAVQSTLSRTVITSATTALTLVVLFIAGSDQIKGFAFAILVGIVVGTYSSIFIATPIVMDFSKEGTLRDHHTPTQKRAAVKA